MVAVPLGDHPEHAALGDASGQDTARQVNDGVSRLDRSAHADEGAEASGSRLRALARPRWVHAGVRQGARTRPRGVPGGRLHMYSSWPGHKCAGIDPSRSGNLSISRAASPRRLSCRTAVPGERRGVAAPGSARRPTRAGPPLGCHTRAPGRVRTARRNADRNGLSGDLRLTLEARVRDGIGAPGSGDLPTFPCVLARPVPLGYALSTCPRVAQLADWPARIKFHRALPLSLPRWGQGGALCRSP